MDADGSEEELDKMIDTLETGVPHPEVSDLIYDPKHGDPIGLSETKAWLCGVDNRYKRCYLLLVRCTHLAKYMETTQRNNLLSSCIGGSRLPFPLFMKIKNHAQRTWYCCVSPRGGFSACTQRMQAELFPHTSLSSLTLIVVRSAVPFLPDISRIF